MKENATVAVVVPVYERPEKIHRFIPQFLSQTFENLMIVVVDHGRRHVDYSAFDDPRLVVLRENSELWWTGAVNRGVEYALRRIAPSGFILVINDDVQVDDTYVQSLVELGAAHPDSIVGSVSVDECSGEVLSASFSLNRLKAKFVPAYYKRMLHEVPNACLCSDILPGRGMLVPARVFAAVGLFLEEALPHYGADNEFSYRARRAGYPLLVSKRCVVRTGKPVHAAPQGGRWRRIRYHLFGIKSKGGLPSLIVLSRLYFRPPYWLYYFLVNAIVKVLATAKHCR